MKIVVLDSKIFGIDMDLSILNNLGDTKIYFETNKDNIISHIADSDIVVTNKVSITKETIDACPSVKMICVAATGYDIVDVKYCVNKKIAVTNVPCYSTESVAQITITMALYLASKFGEQMLSVKSGEYSNGSSKDMISSLSFNEISKMTWGICGYGTIGKKVANIAKSLGCKVIVYSRKKYEDIECVPLDDLCKKSDIISLHLSLNDSTYNIISEDKIKLFKKNCIFINTARGLLTDEKALANAVVNNRIFGLGIDTYSEEPLPLNHPFSIIKNRPNVCFTPHIGWCSQEARKKLVEELYNNINSFINGCPRNLVGQ